MKKVCIINSESGNQKSVYNALNDLGCNPIVSNHISDIESCSHLILPGVGTYNNLMNKVNSLNLIEILMKEISIKEKPFLGICVGMQILSTFGFEFNKRAGLDLIKGNVNVLKTKKLRLPHIGWNNLQLKKKSDIFDGLDEDAYFYFVHSYEFEVEDKSNIISTTNYEYDFVSAVQKNNIFGVQFHPEKSQKSGLMLLKNFTNL